MDWQPIETAPKDGRAVTVYDMYETDWSVKSNGIYSQTGRDGYGVVTAFFKDGKWLKHSRGGVDVRCVNPVRWRELAVAPDVRPKYDR